MLLETPYAPTNQFSNRPGIARFKVDFQGGNHSVMPFEYMIPSATVAHAAYLPSDFLELIPTAAHVGFDLIDQPGFLQADLRPADSGQGDGP
jgi:hypothetical protein